MHPVLPHAIDWALFWHWARPTLVLLVIVIALWWRWIVAMAKGFQHRVLAGLSFAAIWLLSAVCAGCALPAMGAIRTTDWPASITAAYRVADVVDVGYDPNNLYRASWEMTDLDSGARVRCVTEATDWGRRFTIASCRKAPVPRER